LLVEFEDKYFESLALAIARKILDVESIAPVFENVPGDNEYPALDWLKLGNNKIPVDEFVQALVPFRGVQGSFNYVSASDVIHGRVDEKILNGTIVMIGTTTPGLFDLRAVPVVKQYAGVEVHANLLAGIIDGAIKEKPAYLIASEFLLLLFLGLALALFLPSLSPLWATMSSFGLICLAGILNYYVLWQINNLVMPLAPSILMILTIFLLKMSYGFFVESRGKRQIASMFGQYVPPELVDEMSENPDLVSFEAENRVLTVLFSGIRSFTTISESLSPGDLSLLMNEYLTAMTKIIHENHGTIDKYMGDAVMAFWGAPVSDEEHARHAPETGIAMLERLHAIQENFSARGWPLIKIGVGLNSSEMSVGDMVSQFCRAYTVIGDTLILDRDLKA